MNQQKHVRVILSGAYGMNNLGDEAICKTLIADLRLNHPFLQLRVFTFDTKESELAQPDESPSTFCAFLAIALRPMNLGAWRSFCRGMIDILRCDLFIFGGGGLIRNRPQWLRWYILPLRIAQLFRKHIIISPIGVDRIDDPAVIRLVQTIRVPQLFCVRDEMSKTNLLRVRPDLSDAVEVLADPAFHIPTATKRSPRHTPPYRIGINATCRKADFSNPNETAVFFERFRRVIERVTQELPVTLVYLPTVPKKDRSAYEQTLAGIPGVQIETPTLQTPEAYIDALQTLDFFIGMRLHSLILSSAAPVPAALVSYDEKTDALQPLLGNHFFSVQDILDAPDTCVQRLVELIKQPTDTPWQSMRDSSLLIIDRLDHILTKLNLL